jgi:hypothetical protein
MVSHASAIWSATRRRLAADAPGSTPETSIVGISWAPIRTAAVRAVAALRCSALRSWMSIRIVPSGQCRVGG